MEFIPPFEPRPGEVIFRMYSEREKCRTIAAVMRHLGFSAAFIAANVSRSLQFTEALRNHIGHWDWVKAQYERRADGAWHKESWLGPDMERIL